jgi:hypothetical protein
MSIAQNFPTISPSLSMDFAAVQALDPRITYTRASTATYYGTETAKAEENLVLQSEFASGWSVVGVSRTANTSVAPNGTTTADTLTGTSTTNAVFFNNASISFVASSATASIFVKAGTADFVVLSIWTGSGENGVNQWFDLQNGTLGSNSATSGYSYTSSSVSALSDGWYRISVTGTVPAANIFIALRIVDANGTFVYTGTVGDTVLIWGAQLEQRSAVTAYTPTTTQPITNYIPVLETAASGVARFDHNPTTFESLGLLIEQQSTNLLTYSEEFDNAAWTKTNSTIENNTIVAPDGTLTADKFIANSGTGVGSGQVYQEFSATAGVPYTMSVYLKPAGQTLCAVVVNARSSVPAGITFMFINIDLSNGTITSSGNGTFTNVSSTVTPIGNGYYRVTLTATPPATTATLRFNVTNGGEGDGFNGVFVWGVQAEALAFPTSYIPTVASQVTRAADSASMTGTNFSSWFNAGQGAFYIGFNSFNSSASGANFLSGQGAAASLLYSSGSRDIKTFNGSTGGSTINTFALNTFAQAGLSYDTSARSIVLNAGTVVSIVGSIQQISQLSIGQSFGSYLNGTIKKISYYPTALTNTNLQALTG